MPDSEKYH